MKTFKLIGMALMALVMSFSFASCSDDDDPVIDPNSETILGTWENTWNKGYEIYNGQKEEWDEASSGYFIVLQKDGKGYDYETGYESQKDYFTWSIQGNKMQIQYTDEPEQVANVLEFSEKKMVIEYSEKDFYERSTYTKVK